MTTLIKNADVRTIAAGIAVSRATAALPAGVLGNLFTVSGGRILLVALVGEVTTQLGGTATTATLGVAPTTGTASASNLGTASPALASAAVGDHIVANPGGAVLLDTGAGSSVAAAHFLVPVGSITITPSANVGGGSVKWDLVYVPFDAAAQVVAA